MTDSTTFTAGRHEFAVVIDAAAIHRLIGAGLLTPELDGDDAALLGRYEPLLARMAGSFDTFVDAMAALCRRQLDEADLRYSEWRALFEDIPTRQGALTAFFAAARLEREARRRDEDPGPVPVGMVSKA